MQKSGFQTSQKKNMLKIVYYDVGYYNIGFVRVISM